MRETEARHVADACRAALVLPDERTVPATGGSSCSRARRVGLVDAPSWFFLHDPRLAGQAEAFRSFGDAVGDYEPDPRTVERGPWRRNCLTAPTTGVSAASCRRMCFSLTLRERRTATRGEATTPIRHLCVASVQSSRVGCRSGQVLMRQRANLMRGVDAKLSHRRKRILQRKLKLVIVTEPRRALRDPDQSPCMFCHGSRPGKTGS